MDNNLKKGVVLCIAVMSRLVGQPTKNFLRNFSEKLLGKLFKVVEFVTKNVNESHS